MTTEWGSVVRDWWRAHLSDSGPGSARGLAARLRRGSDVDILSEREVHNLAQSLRMARADRAVVLVRLVRVLAELRGGGNTPLARRLGGDDPVLSTARFQRLLRASGDDLTTALIRALRSLPPDGRACNIAMLGRDLLDWGDTTRARWTFDYFHTDAPETLHPPKEALT